MSIPIRFCLVSRAARGDQKAYAELLEAMVYNFGGFWSQLGCKCDPQCPTPSLQEFKALDDRLKADMDNRRTK